MKRSIIYLALGFLTLGCTNLELVDNNSQRGLFPDEYLAYTDAETQTRVFVNTSLKTLWNADDRITIFNDTYNAQWKFNGETGSDNGSFSKVSDEYYTAADTPTTYAVYPYYPATSITTEGNITLTLPAVQHYAENSYGLGANTMVAATKTPTSNALYFKSLCSFVVIQLYGSGTVKSITLTGNNGEKLAGTATVTPVYGEAPVATMSDAATTSITLDCGEGVALGSTSATATEFWFCIPPTTFSKGFTIKAVRTDGYFMEKVTSSKKVFERNTKYAMAAIEGVFDQEDKPDYVPFEDTNFKAYCVQNFDKNGDGEISIEEAETAQSIIVDASKIESIKGIEYFTSLEILNCSLNRYYSNEDSGERRFYNETGQEVISKLKEIDVTHNTLLKELNVGACGLACLDVSNNTALTWLDCSDNQLTSLDVSKNTALTRLGCDYNQLTSLDVSKNTALTNLGCSYNQLTSLDVSKNTALTGLNSDGNQLTSLDVSKNTALTNLGCSYNQLTSLDVSKNTAIEILTCFGNQLTSLDVSKNTALWLLGCNENKLTSLDVSNNTALIYLFCGENQFTSLDVSGSTALASLYCANNKLTSLDVSGCTAMATLQCQNNQLTSLDISKNTALTHLDCYNNQISTIYVWEGFDPSKISIDKDNSAFFEVKIYVPFEDANFKAYCVQNFDKDGDGEISFEEARTVTEINCKSSYIASLKGIEYFTSLYFLGCGNNQLTSLDVSNNTALTILDCYENQLTSLDVSKNTALIYLDCNSNQLTSLDVSKNTALYTLFCWENQLTSLDVSKNTALAYLRCYSNQISTIYVWEGFDPSKISIDKDDFASFVVKQ